jgi:hypothetical protein
MKNRASHLQNNSWQERGISVSCFQIFFIEGKKWRQDQIKDTSFNESFVEGRNRLAFVYFQLNCLWNGKLRKTTLQEELCGCTNELLEEKKQDLYFYIL